MLRWKKNRFQILHSDKVLVYLFVLILLFNGARLITKVMLLVRQTAVQ
jgi:intergrase/recombinase